MKIIINVLLMFTFPGPLGPNKVQSSLDEF